MASSFQTISSNSIGTGVRVDLAADEGAIIKKNIKVRSTSDNAIEGMDYNHEVKVLGEVRADGHGIRLGLSASMDAGQQVTVGNNGKVVGDASGVSIYGYSSEVVNKGMIRGSDAGIYMSGDLDSGLSRIVNSGLIHSENSAAIIRGGSQNFRLENSGTMTSNGEFVYFGSNSAGRQTIVNSGEIKGNVLTGLGDDRFTGDGGFVRGYLWMGAGDDVYKAGSGRVTKVVDGDLGDDTLKGGKLKDFLDGGENRDILTGNGGADHFIFTDHTHSTLSSPDRITDFDRSEKDRIDLHLIDAIPGGTDDAFDFIGKQAFSGTPGELRFRHENGQTFIEGDRNGDMVADFRIELDGKIQLKEMDFIL